MRHFLYVAQSNLAIFSSFQVRTCRLFFGRQQNRPGHRTRSHPGNDTGSHHFSQQGLPIYRDQCQIKPERLPAVPGTAPARSRPGATSSSTGFFKATEQTTQLSGQHHLRGSPQGICPQGGRAPYQGELIANRASSCSFGVNIIHHRLDMCRGNVLIPETSLKNVFP
ncbi:hypothetical protein CEXT_574001 [Caerostris extrusa]|uniref:Uncharacterized protein n=1 Tax=Caerostris extrusa TaxID=172846 RepID=A0AAV4RHR7_CAEEX|nr:hypothetical protein CEXT_574001 [Caerostris extrusa]